MGIVLKSGSQLGLVGRYGAGQALERRRLEGEKRAQDQQTQQIQGQQAHQTGLVEQRGKQRINEMGVQQNYNLQTLEERTRLARKAEEQRGIDAGTHEYAYTPQQKAKRAQYENALVEIYTNPDFGDISGQDAPSETQEAVRVLEEELKKIGEPIYRRKEPSKFPKGQNYGETYEHPVTGDIMGRQKTQYGDIQKVISKSRRATHSDAVAELKMLIDSNTYVDPKTGRTVVPKVEDMKARLSPGSQEALGYKPPAPLGLPWEGADQNVPGQPMPQPGDPGQEPAPREGAPEPIPDALLGDSNLITPLELGKKLIGPMGQREGGPTDGLPVPDMSDVRPLSKKGGTAPANQYEVAVEALIKKAHVPKLYHKTIRKTVKAFKDAKNDAERIPHFKKMKKWIEAMSSEGGKRKYFSLSQEK